MAKYKSNNYQNHPLYCVQADLVCILHVFCAIVAFVIAAVQPTSLLPSLSALSTLNFFSLHKLLASFPHAAISASASSSPSSFLVTPANTAHPIFAFILDKRVTRCTEVIKVAAK